MTWFKEALERRTVSPFQMTQSPVQAIVSALLHNGETKIAEGKFQNFKLHRKRVIDGAARWDIFQLEQQWDRMSVTVNLKIDAPEVFADLPCLFAVHTICKKTRWR